MPDATLRNSQHPIADRMRPRNSTEPDLKLRPQGVLANTSSAAAHGGKPFPKEAEPLALQQPSLPPFPVILTGSLHLVSLILGSQLCFSGHPRASSETRSTLGLSAGVRALPSDVTSRRESK
ncbi:hypothetical protein CI238_00115 [Colletotrichum incanum]|uniref:Uncharacterized protein n=1 Tax=Colletotrichum incanum TaxID=1573173 RepID=A0A166R0R9_COLIC|nr:hypothetical protein CI238_00115 [Colletotrichum incanum]